MTHKKSMMLVFCLILASLMASFFVVNRFKVALESQEQARLGSLISDYPEAETDIIDKFYQTPTEEALLKGREFEGKYGFTGNKRPTNHFINQQYGLMLGLVAGFWLLVLAILWWVFRQQQKETQRYERLEMDFREVNDFLSNTKHQLETEEQATKELITDISHQLKTPLTSLKMNYEILSSKDYSSEEKQTFLKQGQLECQKLEVFLNSLLNISRLEIKMIQVRPTEQLIRETVSAAVNQVYMKAFSKEMDIELIDFDDVSATFDRHWTQEVLVNILDNAIKYSPEASQISVRVTSLVSYVLIEISDQGGGVSKPEATAIFKRFYRGKQQLDVEGTGVGLYLARRIIEEQNGAISVKNNGEGGATFRVTIPFKSEVN